MPLALAGFSELVDESDSVMRQLPGVRNLGAGDRPNLLSIDGDDRSRLAGECDELDLVSLMARINVND